MSQSTVHAIYPPKPDLDAAILFLQAINPDGRQALKSIRDVNGVPEILEEHFGPGCWDEKRVLIEKWAGERRNVYVMVNEPCLGSTDMKEESVEFIRAVFSDTDTKAVQGRALDALDDPMRASRPAYVTDSGGGIHTFFILAVPEPVTPASKALAETVGRGLQSHFEGDAVWNINRIMRVPGTVNYLNAKKRAAGRAIAPTAVLATSADRVTLEDMAREFPAPADTGQVKVSEAAVVAAMAEIDMAEASLVSVSSFSVPAEMMGLWTQGVLNGDATGSGHLFRLALRCREIGLDGIEFAALVMRWPLIGAKQQEHRQLARAWAKASAGAQAARVFDDGEVFPEPPTLAEDGAPVGDIKAIGMKPYSKLPRREWVFGKRLIRKYLSSTVAAGGTGKSSLLMVEAVAMATGFDPFGPELERGSQVREPLRVLMWNGEDPQVELDLRFHAVMKHYGYVEADLGGRLFIVSGRNYPLRIGDKDHHKSDVAWMKRQIETHKIDVVIIDPFVSSHRVPENDNMAIDAVAKTWSMIAEGGRCAVDLVHHIRKPQNGMTMDLTVDDARGASALINASRNARVLSPMSDAMAKTYRVNRRAYFAIQHDATKANMVPGVTGVDWFHFASVDIGNGDPFANPPIEGDNVGVVEGWEATLPISLDPVLIKAAQVEIAKQDYRYDVQGKPWAGDPVAKALGLDPVMDRKLVKATLEIWIVQGWLLKVEKDDKKRNKRDFVVAGTKPDPVF